MCNPYLWIFQYINICDYIKVHKFSLMPPILICYHMDHAVLLSFVVQSLSHVWLFVTPWTTAHMTPLSFTISRSLLKFTSIELVMLSKYLILCLPLLLLLSIFPSFRVFSNESIRPIMAIPSSHMAKVLELQYQFFWWIFRVDFLLNWLVWSPWSPRDPFPCLSINYHNNSEKCDFQYLQSNYLIVQFQYICRAA